MNQSSTQILFHIDGDAFFASCEQSTNIRLRGCPIAVGKDRGIATAFSYEAKTLGVTRGMSGKEIRANFPSVLLVSSDYRKYGLFSRRMKNIIRSYTGEIDCGSIDECWTDVTGLVSNYDQARKLAENMQMELCTKLGLTVSIGVGPNRTIAKIASGMNKPRGITVIAPSDMVDTLYPLPIAQVGGIGSSSQITLKRHGIFTIGDFVRHSPAWVDDVLSKPYLELHKELSGQYVRIIDTSREHPKSISKIRAFSPATSNQNILLSEFARNAEIVASKMHNHGLQASRLTIGVKMYQRRYRQFEITPPQPVVHAQDIIRLINNHGHQLFRHSEVYRATYVAVHHLQNVTDQMSLFEEQRQEQGTQINQKTIAELEKRFGRSVVHTAASLIARNRGNHHATTRQQKLDGMPLIATRDNKRVLDIPYLGVFS